MTGFIATVVRRPIGAVFLAAAVCVLGIISLQQLPVSLLPPVEPPVITVRTEKEGASARELEEQILDRLEQVLGTLPGLVAMDGRCNAGAVEVRLSLRADADLDAAINRLRERLASFRLPDDALPLRIMRYDPGAEPVMRLQLRALPGGPDRTQLALAVRDELIPQLEGLAAVAAVRLRGATEPELRIEPDPAALAAAGLDFARLREALASAVSSRSIGRVETGAGRQNVRLRGTVLRPTDIAAIPLTPRVALGDVAHLTLEDAEATEDARGLTPGRAPEPVLVIELFAPSDIGLVKGVAGITTALDRIAPRDGVDRWRFAGGEIELVHDAAAPVRAAITEVRDSGLVGALLSGAVLIFFLGALRPALLIFAAVPLSLLATFLAMGRADVGINLMSLGGLALGIGMLVDNTIVVLEAAARSVTNHPTAPLNQTITRAVGAIAPAVIASTLTTVAVFVPLAFLPGSLGDLVHDLAFTVSGSLLASLAVALALVPPLLGPALRRRSSQPSLADRVHRRIEDHFGRLLARILRQPGWSLAAFLVICVAGIGSGLLLPRRLLPPVTSRSFICEIGLPRHFDVAASTAWADGLLAELAAGEPSLRALAIAGEDPRFASLLEQRQAHELRLVLVRHAPATGLAEEATWLQAVEASCRRRGAVSAAAWAPATIDLGGGSQDALALAIGGDDPDALRHQALLWQTALRSYGARGVRSSASAIVDEFLVVGEPRLLLEAGITWQHLRDTLTNATAAATIDGFRPRYDGVTPSPTALTLRIAGILRERDAAELMRLDVGKGGVAVPLDRVARLERHPGDGLVVHRDGRLAATLQATWLPDLPARIIDRLQREVPLAAGMDVTDFGIATITGEHLTAMVGMLLLSAFMVLVVMAVQFESLGQPLLVMASIPMAAAGALPSLLLTGQGFDVMSGIGLVVLTGITVNNAIVLVSTANQLRDEKGLSLPDALTAAGRSRLRPILMTTVTTILGLVPLAIGWGEAAALRVPLAIAVIGGMVVSTAMVLLVLPGILVLCSRRRPPTATPD